MQSQRLVASLAALAAGAVLISSAHAASGTCVGTGYTWRDSNDGAQAEPFGFDGTPTTITPVNDSAPTGPINLPWSFPYYGGSPTQIWISDNGWVGFSGPYASSHPTPAANLPDVAAPNNIVAPFWTGLRSDDTLLGLRITHGAAVGGSAYLVEVVAEQQANGAFVGWRMFLYQTGLIRFQYLLAGADLSGITIGIENSSGGEGCRIRSGNTAAPGVPDNIPSGYVIEFEPPPILPPFEAQVVPMACGATISEGLPGNLPAFTGRYSCSPSSFTARERVHSFTLAQASVVNILLTPISGSGLTFFLLEDCNERTCLRGPETNTTIALGAGTYFISVDAPTTFQEGTYNLQLTCTPFATPATCGSTVSGNTAGGTSIFDSYACAGALDFRGTERAYEVAIATPTNLRATLSGQTQDLDVMILPLAGGEVIADSCLSWGDDIAVAWNVPAGSYLIVVDGAQGITGAYTLAIECRVDLQCGTVDGVVDTGTNPVQTISGNTAGGGDVVEVYRCDPGTLHDGPERVYELVLPQPGQVLVYQTGGDPGLSFFILSDCNEGSCVGGEPGRGCSTQLPAGTHYLVVDGANGASGAYDMLVAYEPPFNRWDACEDPSGTTLITDTVSSFWSFNDSAYCYTEPASHNYPDGCIFAMYVVVQCGTAMHIPLYDVESGHLRILDVFRGEYVELTAQSTGGWRLVSDDIVWQDPNCALGTDPRWNNQTTDVFFGNPNGLCGVYRIEFINHSGFEWQLFANCTGAASGLFNIHDSLCGALSEFAPLPNLSLVTASAVASCPDVTVTYQVRNDGCGLARDVQVRLLDNGVEVATDVLPEAPYGQTVTRTFMARYSVTPTTSVTLTVDPDDLILECSEPAAGGASCDPISGGETLPLPGCVGVCQVQADAVASPVSTCAGGTVNIDASASSSSDCGGNVLEYQLRANGVIVVPFPGSAVFPPQAPGQTTDYEVEVRCATSATCIDSETFTVTVERPPLFDPLSVAAADLSSCNLGIRVSWAPATFYGPTGTGVYNVYRSTVSCADAISTVANLVGSCLAGTSFTDTGTSEGIDYYYVVEAEDVTPAVNCPIVGACYGGAATRVDVQAGTCAAVQDSASPRPDLLPRVGGSLRLGGTLPIIGARYGETFVDLQWTTDVPIDPVAGEHFHILRSEQPNAGFTLLLPEPPLLTAQVTRDSNAGDTVGNEGLHIWHYLVYVSDACENDNRGYDNP